MIKPREKTRDELTAKIEDGQKKIRQYENRDKMLNRRLAIEKRKERNHRLYLCGGYMERQRNHRRQDGGGHRSGGSHA